MRLKIFSVVALAASGILCAQTPKRDCFETDPSIVTSLLKQDIVGFQMQLWVLSLEDFAQPEEVESLRQIARGAVLALANTIKSYSAIAPKSCLSWKAYEEYDKYTPEANNFILFLNITHTAERPWLTTAMSTQWPLKNIPPMAGHLADNPAIRGHKLPMHPAIEGVLESYARLGSRVDVTDAIQIAALEILGQAQSWDIRKFKVNGFAKKNAANFLAADHFFFDGRAQQFEKMPFREKLRVVGGLYE